MCDTRCKSVPLSERVIETRQQTAQALEIVERSNLTPTERATVRRALETSQALAETTDRERVEAEAEAEGLKKYRLWVFTALGAVAGFFLIRRFV